MKNFQQPVTPESVISGTTSAMQEEEDRTTPTSVGTGTISGTVADDLESEISGEGFEKVLKITSFYRTLLFFIFRAISLFERRNKTKDKFIDREIRFGAF